jgi:hypothetical protein
MRRLPLSWLHRGRFHNWVVTRCALGAAGFAVVTVVCLFCLCLTTGRFLALIPSALSV